MLKRIYTAVLDASRGETHSIQDTIYSRQVDVHSTPQEINALQMTLDATDDEDEQLTLEDITGKLLWLSWCEILSEVEPQLLEVLNYIRRKRDSMMLEEHGHFYQCLNEIGKIIKKTPHVHVDDDLAHLQRIMLDAGAGVSKHRLWLAGQATEQNKWSSQPPCCSCEPYQTCPHIPGSPNSGHHMSRLKL